MDNFDLKKIKKFSYMKTILANMMKKQQKEIQRLHGIPFQIKNIR